MRRKRRSGASGGESAEVLVSCGFPRLRGIWFTVAFRETITIAAIGYPGALCSAAIGAFEGMGPGSVAAQEYRTPSGTRTIACRAMRRRWSDQQCGEFGQQRRAYRRRRKERGRRRTRQDQISPGP